MMSLDVCKPLIGFEAPRAIGDYLHRHNFKKTFEFVAGKLNSDDSRRLMKHLIIENNVSQLSYRQALFTHRANYIRQARHFMDENKLDFLLYPTLPIRPCVIDDYKEANLWEIEHNGQQVSWLSKSIQNTEFASVVNFPSISFPASLPTEGLPPINMELCSETGSDRRLLAVACAVEEALGIRE